MNNDNASVTMEELFGMDDNENTIVEAQTLKTGVNVGDIVQPPKKDGVNPNAVRWIFSPFEYINVANDPAVFSVSVLKNIAFNKIESIPTRVKHNSYLQLAASPFGNVDDESNYQRIDRTAFQQTKDLIDRHAEKGVTVISSLMGADVETANELNQLLFGSEIICIRDMYAEDYPCPVLPDLLELLQANVQKALQIASPEMQVMIASATTEIRTAIRAAQTNAQTRINEAQVRMSDERSVNRSLAPAEQRCYLALGREIPDVIPFVTKSQFGSMNSGQQLNTSGLGAEIAAGVIAGMREVNRVEVPIEAPVNKQAEAINLNDFAAGAIKDASEAAFPMNSEVTVGGRPGKVVHKPGGRITVQFEDGERQTFAKDQLS